MLQRVLGAAIVCAVLAPALAPALAQADTADAPGAPQAGALQPGTPRLGMPMHEIFAREVLPSVGGMQDPGAVTPQSLNGVAIHIKMTKASALAMRQMETMHPFMKCKIEPGPHDRGLHALTLFCH